MGMIQILRKEVRQAAGFSRESLARFSRHRQQVKEMRNCATSRRRRASRTLAARSRRRTR